MRHGDIKTEVCKNCRTTIKTGETYYDNNEYRGWVRDQKPEIRWCNTCGESLCVHCQPTHVCNPLTIASFWAKKVALTKIEKGNKNMSDEVWNTENVKKEDAKPTTANTPPADTVGIVETKCSVCGVTIQEKYDLDIKMWRILTPNVLSCDLCGEYCCAGCIDKHECKTDEKEEENDLDDLVIDGGLVGRTFLVKGIYEDENELVEINVVYTTKCEKFFKLYFVDDDDYNWYSAEDLEAITFLAEVDMGDEEPEGEAKNE